MAATDNLEDSTGSREGGGGGSIRQVLFPFIPSGIGPLSSHNIIILLPPSSKNEHSRAALAVGRHTQNPMLACFKRKKISRREVRNVLSRARPSFSFFFLFFPLCRPRRSALWYYRESLAGENRLTYRIRGRGRGVVGIEIGLSDDG